MSKDGIGQILASNPWTSLALTAFVIAALANPHGTIQALSNTFNALHQIASGHGPDLVNNFLHMPR